MENLGCLLILRILLDLNTFRFKDLKDELLDELIEKENIIPKKENKKDNDIKVYCEN